MFNIANILNINEDGVSKADVSVVDKTPGTNASTSKKRPREINVNEEHGNTKKQKINIKYDLIPISPVELPIKLRDYIINKLEQPHQCDVESCVMNDFREKITNTNENLNAIEIEETQQFHPDRNLKKRHREDSENSSDTTSKKMKHIHECGVVTPNSTTERYNWRSIEANNFNTVKQTQEYEISPCSSKQVISCDSPHIKENISKKRPREEKEMCGSRKRAKQYSESDVIIIDGDDPLSTNADNPQLKLSNSKIIVGIVDGRVAVPNAPTFLASGEIRDMLQQHYIINNQQMIFKMSEPELFALKYNEYVEKLHVSAHHKCPNIEMQFRKLQHSNQTHPRYAPENIHNIKIPEPSKSHINFPVSSSIRNPPPYRSSENISVNMNSLSRAPVKRFDIESILK